VIETAPIHVLCSGNIVCDILVQPVDTFLAGATTPVDRIERRMGGNGANTAYALARMGTPVVLAGVVGADECGEFTLRRLDAAGVDISLVGRSSKPTASTVVLVGSKGQRSFLHLFGASEDAALDSAVFAASGCNHFHLASPFGLPLIRPHKAALLEVARAAGMTTSLDTHWDSLSEWMRDLAPCLPLLDLLFINEDEARMLAGGADPMQAARTIRAAGARQVVLKLGAAGCSLFWEGGECAVPGFQIDVVDTTGAGDCFTGGFLAAMHRGASLVEAARFANAVGALSVSALGATEGLLDYEAASAWIANAAPFELP
jgi:sugar/nucleoside kinase (ribokinase family)